METIYSKKKRKEKKKIRRLFHLCQIDHLLCIANVMGETMPFQKQFVSFDSQTYE